jgi:integrase
MNRPRRRADGEGAVIEYPTRAGVRYAIKWREQKEDGSERQVLRRRTRDGREMTSRKEAAEELGSILAKIREGAYVTPTGKITVGEWLDQWLAGLRLAPSTRASYAKNIRLHLKPKLGGIQLSRLTGTKISALYRELERTGRQDHRAGAGLSARTVRYIHTIVKAALQEAVTQGLLASNPAEKAKPPSAKEAKPPEMVCWNAEQLAASLQWVDHQNYPDAVAWRVLAYTGMRRGECLALRWRDLDLDKSTLRVRRSVGVVKTKGKGEQLIEGPTKSTKPRVIDLDPQTVAALRSWRLARAGLDLRLAREDALIFGDLEGHFLHPDRFYRRFQGALKACRRQLGEDALPRITVHDLRHTHATILLAAGVPVKVVSERLGHASITITLQIYAHVMPGMQAAAAAQFAALIGGQP